MNDQCFLQELTLRNRESVVLGRGFHAYGIMNHIYKIIAYNDICWLLKTWQSIIPRNVVKNERKKEREKERKKEKNERKEKKNSVWRAMDDSCSTRDRVERAEQAYDTILIPSFFFIFNVSQTRFWMSLSHKFFVDYLFVTINDP